MKLCFAPMDGITNCATRLITQQIWEKFGNPEDEFLLWTEFMNADGYLINPTKVIKHLQTTFEQKPIAQIYGGKEESLIACAKEIQKKYSDLFGGIEINTGCPSNTVMKVGGGSDMMKDKEKTLRIIQHIQEAIGETSGKQSLPFSIKARIGINDEDKKHQKAFLVQASEFCEKISIHGRTLKQLYFGEADRDFIAEVKEEIEKNGKVCKVIGNGGILSYEQAQSYQQQFGLDGIMIGQGAIGNPWIFTPHQPTLEEKKEVILQHLNMMIACDILFERKVEILGEKSRVEKEIIISKDEINKTIHEIQMNPDQEYHSIVEFRKFLFQYIKGIPNGREWKQSIIQIKNYAILKTKIEELFGKALIY